MRFLRQISGTEEETPAVAASWELAKAVQATEMVCGVSGAGGRVLEAEEGLVLAVKEGVHFRKHFVAELCTVYLGAESGKFVAAGAPPGDEVLARHGQTAPGIWQTVVSVPIRT